MVAAASARLSDSAHFLRGDFARYFAKDFSRYFVKDFARDSLTGLLACIEKMQAYAANGIWPHIFHSKPETTHMRRNCRLCSAFALHIQKIHCSRTVVISMITSEHTTPIL
jgi:hypothetical protein